MGIVAMIKREDAVLGNRNGHAACNILQSTLLTTSKIYDEAKK